jgi:hypothetical protein
MDENGQESPGPAEEPTPKPIQHETAGPDYWKRPSHRTKYLLVLIIVVLLAGGGYWFLIKDKTSKSTVNPNSQKDSSASSAITAKTQHYSSQNFALEFDYPQDWTVADDAGSGKLTATSPTMKLKDANGQDVNGRIIFTIRDHSQKLTEFDKGNATAVRDSEKIAYTKPSPSQRGSTYISFLQYATSPGGGSLDGIHVTGDNGYQKGQAIPLVDISKSDPIISITFVRCNDNQCSKPTQFSVQATSWNESLFSTPLKNMLESLAIV